MELDARRRLKSELATKGISAKDLSEGLGFASTYVSRLITGNIKEPSESRIRMICDEADLDWVYIVTGNRVSDERKRLLDDLAQAPDDLIEDVVAFVAESGLGQK